MAEENTNTQPEQQEEQQENPATEAQSQQPEESPAVDAAALQAQFDALQLQNAQYQQAALSAQIAQQATLEAVALGIDAKTIPYVLRMADMSSIKVNKDGTFDIEAIQAALNKVLDDVPVLKPQQSEESNGFKQIGAGSGDGDLQPSDALARIFGNKK